MNEIKDKSINKYYQLSLENKNRLVIVFAIPSQRLRPQVPYEFDLVSFRKNNKTYSFIAIEYLEIIRFRKLGFLLNSQFPQTNYMALVRIRGQELQGFFYWGGTIGNKIFSFLHFAYPWYPAYYQKTISKDTNSLSPIKLFSEARELSCSLEYQTNKTKIHRNTKSKGSLLERIKYPQFTAFEKNNSLKIRAYEMQRSHEDEFLVKILNVNPEVLKNMCLLTENEEKKPYAAYLFGAGKLFSGKRLKL